MQDWIKNIKNNKDKSENLKQENDNKKKEKESCRFLFDMIGRVFSK